MLNLTLSWQSARLVSIDVFGVGVRSMAGHCSLIIFDTEFTAWEGSAQRKWSLAWEYREVIQIAAVRVNISTQGAKVVSSFNTLVRPIINSTLSEYIIQLTGIEQNVLDNMGVDFPVALHQLHAFCQNGQLPCYSWGNDQKVLMENCALNQIQMPDFTQGFFNLHAMARKTKVDGAHLCSGELANHLGLNLHGHTHNALYDVRSIALALNCWMEKGVLPPALFLENSVIH